MFSAAVFLSVFISEHNRSVTGRMSYTETANEGWPTGSVYLLTVTGNDLLSL